MTRDQVRETILRVGIVPVVRASSAQQALLAAEAVRAGGIPVVEITMTVPGAIEVIAELSRSAGGEILIGAGTVLDAISARRCIDAGAEFLASPGFNRQTVEAAVGAGKLMIAGALTPTEVIAAFDAGSDLVKIFPCGNIGGPAYIKALKSALPQIPMLPTGGVNFVTIAEYFLAGASAVGIGGELISRADLEAGDSGAIAAAARKYAAIVKETRATARR